MNRNGGLAAVRSLPPGRPIRTLFVNGGILGLASFHQFLQEFLPRQTAIDGTHIVLTEELTLFDRAIRRAICQRVWVDGVLGLRNLDLARLRHEMHAGLLARRRIQAAGPERFDVIHFHRQAAAYGSLDLMRRVPSVVSMDCTQECIIDGATSAVERASYAPNVRIDGATFRRAAAVIATSSWAADSLHRYYPDCATPVHVMPNPVLLPHFDRGWIEQRRIRAQSGRLPRLLFIGGDFPRKGGADLLAAWQAGGFHGRAELEIVTNWDLPGPLPAGVTQTRNITAHSPQWRALWAAADAFVMPTINEAFGLVYQEAAAAGIPAIGTNHNAVPEIILDGETGLLVPVGDRQGLAEAMHALVDSPELRARLGSQGRDRIEIVASPETYMERLTAILTDAAQSRTA
ncbi:MAG: glycosyltransferase family 4 protein [Acidobacteriota bacterium]